MAISLEELKDAILDLPDDQRAELAEFISKPIDAKEAAAIRAEWLAVARRRIDELESGKVVGIPADQVLDNLFGDDE